MSNPQNPINPQDAHSGTQPPPEQPVEHTTAHPTGQPHLKIPKTIIVPTELTLEFEEPTVTSAAQNEVDNASEHSGKRGMFSWFGRKQPRASRANSSSSSGHGSSTGHHGNQPPPNQRGVTPSGSNEAEKHKGPRRIMRNVAVQVLDFVENSLSGQLLNPHAQTGASEIEKKLDDLIAFNLKQRKTWRWRRNFWRFAWPPSAEVLDRYLVQFNFQANDVRDACQHYHASFAKKNGPGLWDSLNKQLAAQPPQATVANRRQRARETYALLRETIRSAKQVRKNIHTHLAMPNGKVSFGTINYEVSAIAQFTNATLIRLQVLLSQPPAPASQPTAQTCLNCGTLNLAGRFCTKCGAPIGTLPCPHCQTINQANSLFCQDCGLPLTPPMAGAAPSVTPQPPQPMPGSVNPPISQGGYTPMQSAGNPAHPAANQVPQPGYPQSPNNTP